MQEAKILSQKDINRLWKAINRLNEIGKKLTGETEVVPLPKKRKKRAVRSTETVVIRNGNTEDN